MSTALSHRGRVAALTRSRPADDPELIEAKQALKAATTEAWIQKQLASAPPLTVAQREKLAHLLAPSVTTAEAGGAG